MSDSPYVIGIDLGTTNTAMAYAEAGAETPSINIFRVPQVTAPGEVSERDTLPSFIYIPGKHELADGSYALPWNEDIPYITGEFAMKQGIRVPDRLVSSSKSWLCAGEADREGLILPWTADPKKVSKISPVESAMKCLSHLYDAWNHAKQNDKGANFCLQTTVLTVPASFDAAARDLTVKAATASGMDVILLEEPQAALYAWLNSMGDEWRKQLKVGDTILVCDIGGGTTDFSLIAVSDNDGNLELERISVGDHILLGGDNMDLAAAMALAAELRAKGKKLDAWQLNALCRSCSAAKVRLLSDASAEEAELVIPGRSSSLFGGSISVVLKKELLEKIILDGFFPEASADAKPQRKMRSGLSEMGLPYEQDAAVTRHLASFISSNRELMEKKGYPALPTKILLNGGVFKSSAICSKFISEISKWYPEGGAPKILEGADLDLAVAKGAAAYALSRRGKGIRIKGGTSRSYYIGLESSMPSIPGFEPPVKALCLAKKGVEEGTEIPLPEREFSLAVGYDAEFRFFSANGRPDDDTGDIIEDWEECGIIEQPSLKTSLDPGEGKNGGMIPVTLETRITEIGTIELWCRDREGVLRKLEFDIRHSGETEE